MELEVVSKVLIVNASNQALVLRTGVHKLRPESSHAPDLPGGLVEASEDILEAGVREVKEETGIELTASSLRLVYAETKPNPNENKSVTKLLYIALVEQEPEVTLSWEHEAYEWVSIGELAAYGLRPFYQQAIEYAIANRLLG